MIILNDSTVSLACIVSAAGLVNFNVSYADIGADSFDVGAVRLSTSTAATQTLVTGSATAGVKRQIKLVTVMNDAAVGIKVALATQETGIDYELTPAVTLAPGECLTYVDGAGFSVLNPSGLPKSSTPSMAVGGNSMGLFKTGSSFEAAGVGYCFLKDSGFPGATTLGTPGLAGAAVTPGSLAGLWTPPNPSAGGRNYMNYFEVYSTVLGRVELNDLLWYNTGIVVTTTTAQSWTPVAAPARDNNDSTGGLGVRAAILVTGATTNASAVTNMTISYTNSDGVAGRVGTMPSFPATAVLGTLIPFNLAAGDRGVRSIQSITLGTSLGGGSVSLLLVNPAITAIVAQNHVPSVPFVAREGRGVRLANDFCGVLAMMSNGTTASTLTVSMAYEEFV